MVKSLPFPITGIKACSLTPKLRVFPLNHLKEDSPLPVAHSVLLLASDTTCMLQGGSPVYECLSSRDCLQGQGLTSSGSALTTHPKYLTLWVRTLRLTPCILCILRGGLWRPALESSVVLSACELDGCLFSQICWDLLGVWKLFSQINNVYVFISFSSWNKINIETLCPFLCSLLGKDIGSRTFWTAMLYSMGQCQGYIPPSFSRLLFLLTPVQVWAGLWYFL